MTVTLMLAWFDEPEELLHQCVTSAAVIADRIVAADGAYEQVIDKRPASPGSQRETLMRAAAAAHLDIDFLPARIWKGQVEKRNALLKAATEGFETGDYVMPLDADWVLHGSREAIRHELDQDHVEEYRVWFHQTVNPGRSLSTAPHDWHRSYNGKSNREPLLFRALHEMKLEKTHWHYSGCRKKGGRRVGLSGGPRLGYAKPASKEMEAPFWIEHRAMFRDDKQLDRNRLFCEVRDAERDRVGFER